MEINFKKFNQKEYERTFGNSWSGNYVMFMCPDDVVRIGRLHEDYHGNGHTSYYFDSGNAKYAVNQCLYAEVKINLE